MHSSRTADRERGIALLLAFLTLLVLVAVIGQITVSSSVDFSMAQQTVSGVEYDYASRAAAEKAFSLLIRDLKDEQAESQAGGPFGGGGGGGEGAEGGDPFGGPAGGMGGAGGSGEEGNEPTDSLLDDWADPTETRETFGDVEVTTRVIDEDRKFNLYALVAEDEEYRQLSRERFIRLVDGFREESEADLSVSDGGKLADGIENWLREKRDDDFPRPLLATDEGDEPESGFASDEKKITFVLGLDEFLRAEGFTDALLHGFMEDERYVPGLEDVVTVFSNLTFDEQAAAEALGEAGDDEGFESPFDKPKDAGGEGAAGEGEEGEGEGEGEGAGGPGAGPGAGEQGSQASKTNHGRINVNTAPMCVLRSVMPTEKLPWSVLDKVDEYRRKAFEEEEGAGLVFSGDETSRFEKDDDEEEEEDEDEDFLFHTPAEVLAKVEEHFNVTLDLPEETRQEFADALAVKSNVFTVFLEARKQTQGGSIFDDRTDRAPPDRIFRAVVWRRVSAEGQVQILQVVPLHAWTGILPPNDEDYTRDHPYGF